MFLFRHCPARKRKSVDAPADGCITAAAAAPPSSLVADDLPDVEDQCEDGGDAEEIVHFWFACPTWHWRPLNVFVGPLQNIKASDFLLLVGSLSFVCVYSC